MPDQLILDRFEKISQKSQTHELKIQADEVKHLPLKKQKAWSKVLGSVASAEGTEQDLMGPIIERYKNVSFLKDYFLKHAKDEEIHHKALIDYIFKTFGYEKKGRTLSDKIIYDGIFKKFGMIAKKRPIPFIAVLYFYESFSEKFYASVRDLALKEKLFELDKLLSIVEKDELRHRAGLKAYFSLLKKNGDRGDRIDYLLTRFMLSTVCFDVNVSKNAWHNKKVRENMIEMGLDPDDLSQSLSHYVNVTMKEVREVL